MKKTALLCSQILLFGFFSILYAQSITLTGRVAGKTNGEPLPGASITIKGTQNGTTTDNLGAFKLAVPGPGTIVVISYAGYTPMEIAVRNDNPLSIELDLFKGSLDEVIVVGYGTQSKRTVTNAISSVKASDLENMPVFRVEQSLQGRVSGLTITSNSGQPGDGATIRVRGTTSINSSNPLYIVDGVQIGGGIEYLNQADIESIDVLKDAASAAIYGARGAAGVILVTTKKGKRGQMSVSYNGYAGTQKASRKLTLLDAQQYATLINEASVAGGGEIRYPNPAALGKGTDWQAAVFNDNAPIQNHELSISAGSEKSTYFGSFGYLNQEGIVASSNSNFERFTTRFNSTHRIAKGVTFGNNIGYTYISAMGVGTNGEWGTPLNRAINIDPITPLIITDPNVINSAPYNNPLAVRNEYNYPYGISSVVTSEILNPIAALKVAQGNGYSHKIVGNAWLEIEPIQGLKFKSTIGTDLAFWGDHSFSPLYYLNATNQNTLNGYTRNLNRGLFWVWENTLSYTKAFGLHRVTALAGVSAQKNQGQTQGGSKRGIPVDNIKDASLAFPVAQTNQFFWGGEYLNTLSSLFGRLQYDFNQKYLLSATVRRDGSSRFGPNNKYGYFPSASAGWIISKEGFWQTNNAVSFLKLRGSYGINGSDNIGDFLYLSTVGGGRNYLIGNTLVNGVSPNAISNPDLKWEETAQTNIGLEAVLFKNFNLTLDVYNKKTKGMLLGISVPGYVGNNGPTGNIADMENKGVELELGYGNKIGEFNYRISANVSYLQNEVTYLGTDKTYLNGQVFGPQGVEFTRTALGHPIGSFFGYKTDGLFQNEADILAHKGKQGALLQPNARPGDIRFKDVNGDGALNADDRTIIGDPTPDWSYGFNISANYKGFDMVLFGQGVAGNDVFQAIRRFDLPTANYTTEALGRWTGEGTSNKFPRLVLNDPNQNFSRSSDFFLQKGDYFRIKVLQIGYTIPINTSRKIGLSKARVYLTGNNLLTFTRYNGYDPEVGGGSYGVDRGIYPQARSLMAGVNLSF